MKSKRQNFIVIDGCGDVLLDKVLRCLSVESQGNGQALVHTDNLNSDVSEIWEHLESLESATSWWKNYSGFILLRR